VMVGVWTGGERARYGEMWQTTSSAAQVLGPDPSLGRTTGHRLNLGGNLMVAAALGREVKPTRARF
jgi:hypothetical protein